MVFSSTLFLFIFLPIAIGVHLLLPQRLRNVWLLLVSLLFYAWGEPQLVWVMLATILSNYAFGLWIGRVRGTPLARRALAIAITVDLGVLAAFKYAGFVATSLNAVTQTLGIPAMPVPHWVMPLGISFFTFHAMSYVIDVYRKDAEPQKNLANLALYVTLFPQLVAGPILRYHEVAWQFPSRKLSVPGAAYGMQRFLVGLGKKVLIANTLAVPCDRIFALPSEQLNLATSWLGILCYTGQIYFDFSGYSDMAIGLGHMLGFRFPENFRWPYASQSIREFWRRWHISLSNWFRDYLYIPLGGNRRGEIRNALNLLTVFFLCGLWHGASFAFIAWGLYHGAFLALERTRWGKWMDALPRPMRHFYALLVVIVGWVPFRAATLGQAWTFLHAMVGIGGPAEIWPVRQFLTLDVEVALLVGVFGALPLLPWLGARIEASGHRVLHHASAALAILAMLGMLLACTVMLAASTHNPFIYFRF
jgi:alginate O-acetyltransferase complex protein AlgI